MEWVVLNCWVIRLSASSSISTSIMTHSPFWAGCQPPRTHQGERNGELKSGGRGFRAVFWREGGHWACPAYPLGQEGGQSADSLVSCELFGGFERGQHGRGLLLSHADVRFALGRRIG
ncbi:MAG TPA: hypothetical protein VMV81_02770, partial [Phycisphaerae bacterium]|nr:hypothetical protein [Phycisphaerae bacterium]